MHIYIVLLWIVGIIGYVINVLQVVAAFSQTLTVLLALKVLGVGVPPVGAIMGLCSLF